jgi:hypothetical protein
VVLLPVSLFSFVTRHCGGTAPFLHVTGVCLCCCADMLALTGTLEVGRLRRGAAARSTLPSWVHVWWFWLANGCCLPTSQCQWFESQTAGPGIGWPQAEEDMSTLRHFKLKGERSPLVHSRGGCCRFL